MNVVALTILAVGSAALTVGPEPNPALQHDQKTIASESLSRGGSDLQQTKLDLARRQREQGDFGQAEKVLVSVIESDAPDELQRSALLELAITAQQRGEFARAQQVFAQFLQRFPDDPSLPEVLLRQGLLYRQMGAHTMALAKFYAVMTTVLNLKLDNAGRCQRLVLQAQIEIADTYYLEGRFAEAVECFDRLLKLSSPDLNKEVVHLKLLRCLSGARRHQDVIGQGQDVLMTYPDSADQAEVRFLITKSLQQLGLKSEALRQALVLIQSPRADQGWKQRVGNEIANQFYADGDYANALNLYLCLLQEGTSADWQLPLLYQVALTYEHLQQPAKAAENYALIEKRGAELGTDVELALKSVLDMARWRKNYLAWQTEAQQTSQLIHPTPTPDNQPLPR